MDIRADGAGQRPGGYGWVRTRRLDLQALAETDLDAVFELHSDAGVWRHLPSGRHADREQSERYLRTILRDWTVDGLGYWLVRRRDDRLQEPAAGPVLGVAGVAPRPGPVWNLYYRLWPDAHGHGYATEVAAAAQAAAAEVDPTVPVIAFLLEHNVASRRTAERSGLHLVWRGPDRGNPDPQAVRLVFADRPLDDAVLARVVAGT